MDKVSVVLRVFFEDPFWIGVMERADSGKMAVCKITFGPEPKDCEVHGFLAKEYYGLRFSPAVAAEVKEVSRNPKRKQREVHKQVKNTGMGTKSQMALKLQQEQLKMERKTVNREKREAEKERKFELKRQKKEREA